MYIDLYSHTWSPVDFLLWASTDFYDFYTQCGQPGLKSLATIQRKKYLIEPTVIRCKQFGNDQNQSIHKDIPVSYKIWYMYNINSQVSLFQGYLKT